MRREPIFAEKIAPATFLPHACHKRTFSTAGFVAILNKVRTVPTTQSQPGGIMFTSPSKPATLLIGILAAVLLFGFSHQVTFARLLECRSDPVVLLSDGTLVDVSADIDTLLLNVTEVHYTLHIPQGLSPILVIRTKAWLTSTETFSFYADQAAHQYSSSTIVQTRSGNTDVTADMLVNLGYGQANGMTGQILNINLTDN